MTGGERITELYIDGAWVDISDDVRLGHTITRGRSNEASRVAPSSCSLALHNPDGEYSPRNPNSAYFGKLGQNTELRVIVDGVNTVLDTFTRTVSAGWGTADNGLVWNPENTDDADYSTNGTVGRHSCASVNQSRFTFIDEQVGLRDPDLTVTVSAPVLATGAAIRAGLVIRGTGSPPTANQYTAWLAMNTDQTMHLELTKTVAAVQSVLGTDTTTGLTHAAGTQYKVRLQANGTALKAKCWLAASAEPDAWNLEVADSDFAAGSYGCRSRLDPSNTNTLPVAISFDNLEQRNVRFHGEMSVGSPRWDLSGRNVTLPVDAFGTLRRLGQGVSPLRSALYRYHTSSPKAGYWPMEDGTDAAAFAEGFGRRPMTLDDDVSPGSASQIGLGGSAPLAVLGTGARCVATVSPHTATSWSVMFMLKVAFDNATNTPLAEWYTGGNPGTWRLTVETGATPAMRLSCYNDEGTLLPLFGLVFTFTSTGLRSLVDEWVVISVTADWDGEVDGVVDYSLLWFSDGLLWGGSDTGEGSVGPVRAFQFGAPSLGAALDGTSVGHLVIQDEPNSVFAGFGVYTGTEPEAAGDRLTRLCEEEGVPFQLIGAAADTEPMGAQRIATLLDLLNDCADIDGGILYEPRDRLGLAYRTKRSLYNQTAALALDYTAGQLAPPFEPVDDDALIRNDITVERRGGSSARAVQETGPRNVQDPSDDPQGVGRYDERVTLDVFTDGQSEQIASWRRHLGTWDEARYPSVSVNLLAPDVAADSALVTAVAGLDLGGLLTIDNPPAWLPPDLIELLAQGYRERLGTPEWDITLNASPAGPYQVMGVYDADASRYDTDGSTINEDLTTTEADITVVTTGAATGSPLWSTTASDFDINIGGERMTVTDVTGASSPQTFTVVRSVNGIVKTHSSGAPVSLWRPARYAL